jgi:hypothetical protein
VTNNWDAYSHRALYNMIHGRLPDGWEKFTAALEGLEPGAGVTGAEAALQCWGELAALMDQARAATELALRDAGAHWEGEAAEAMQAGVTPLVQWAADANTAGAATQSSVDGHVASFSGAQHRMPEPVPVTTGMPNTFPEIFAGQTDQDRQEAAAQEAKAEAVRVMTGYEGESTAAATSLGTFVPPPSVTIQVPPANPVGGEIGGAFVGPTGGSGGDSGGDSGGGRGTRAGTPESAGSDAGSAPDATDDAQITTPGQVVPIGGATPTPGSPPDQVTQRSTTPTNPVLPVGPGPIGARSTAGGGSWPPGGAGGVANPGPGPVPNPGRGGAGVPGSAGVRGGAGPTVARGFAGTSMVPLGAVGPTKGDPDRDHKPPAYLRDTHDDFWDDTPPVSPPVIGEEEE